MRVWRVGGGESGLGGSGNGRGGGMTDPVCVLAGDKVCGVLGDAGGVGSAVALDPAFHLFGVVG